MLEGVDRPCKAVELLPPQALIKLRAIIIKNFFIDLSDYVIVDYSNKTIMRELHYQID